MDNREKIRARLQLGITLKHIIAENAKIAHIDSISSLRKLAAASGVEYSIIQKITTGSRDPQFTTLLSIADGLNISLRELLEKFENVHPELVNEEYVQYHKKQQQKRSGE